MDFEITPNWTPSRTNGRVPHTSGRIEADGILPGPEQREAVLADVAGSFIHCVGFDITELKQVQEALQEERKLVSAIFDTVGALIVVLDPEGRIERFNRACEQMTGYRFEEARGRYMWELFLAPEEVGEFKD